MNDKSNNILLNNFALNFQLVNDECPTHNWLGKNPSRIDVILSNNIIKVKFFGHFGSGISFHDVIMCSAAFHSNNHNERPVIASRNFKIIDLVALHAGVADLNWDFSLFSPAISMVRSLSSNISSFMEQFAPWEQIKVKHAPRSWFNNEIKDVLESQNVAHNLYKRSLTEFQFK